MQAITKTLFGGFVSDMMVKPHQSPLFDNPGDYGLDYEDVEFITADGVQLRGWLVKGGNDKVIIQSHFGVQCNRAGYRPTGFVRPWGQIHFLRHAKYFSEQGYSVLMYDFRSHGESANGPIPWVSWGKEEAKDVVAAVEYITNGRSDFKNAQIGLLSICMGGGASVYAYGLENGLQKYSAIKAMIVVQPLLYNDFIDAFGMPGLLANAGGAVTKDRLGMDLREVSFLPYAESIRVPTLVVQNKNDPWTKLDFVKEFFDSITTEKEMMFLDLEKNRFVAYEYIGTAPEQFLPWFQKHME
mmetsp:Transcript_22204/g.54246  ORF Transcript_22204/g.54246 Transcript_22204/m.54246 type:complete len:298 (+) Transcript_22204:143-1036(+)